MWTCLNCAEENDDDTPACAVCATRSQPRVAGAAPAGTRVPMPREATSPTGHALPPASVGLESTAGHRQAADPWAPTPPAAARAASAVGPPGPLVGRVRPEPAYASVVATDPAPAKPYVSRLILAVVLA